MTVQNYEEDHEPMLDQVKERVAMIDKLVDKFRDLPEVQGTLKSAKKALLESEEEIMQYYDLTEVAKTKLS